MRFENKNDQWGFEVKRPLMDNLSLEESSWVFIGVCSQTPGVDQGPDGKGKTEGQDQSGSVYTAGSAAWESVPLPLTFTLRYWLD